ncbi:hypothetical protein P7K49_037072 [Saguinus oedipus]|uniref:Uncharacterized protein n=1 Tax=Saguinus oedipus TaxID=9490 RepID=A0ABQ9TLY2_SAGOE|nr:hypothetical protein P7K49_037072 [Saguinus oedipus]
MNCPEKGRLGSRWRPPHIAADPAAPEEESPCGEVTLKRDRSFSEHDLAQLRSEVASGLQPATQPEAGTEPPRPRADVIIIHISGYRKIADQMIDPCGPLRREGHVPRKLGGLTAHALDPASVLPWFLQLLSTLLSTERFLLAVQACSYHHET